MYRKYYKHRFCLFDILEVAEIEVKLIIAGQEGVRVSAKENDRISVKSTLHLG